MTDGAPATPDPAAPNAAPGTPNAPPSPPDAAPATPPAGDFKSMLSPEYRDHASLKDFPDVNALAKSFIDTQKMVGNSIRIPAEDATDEEKHDFYSRLGRPEDPEGYKLSERDAPEGFETDEEMLKSFKQVSHSLGLTPQQVEGIDKWHANYVSHVSESIIEQRAEEAQKTMVSLRQEFGALTDKKLQVAKGALAKFGGESVQNFLNETGLGNNADMIKMFAKIGEAIGEDQIISGMVSTQTQLTPEAAKEEIMKLNRDPEFQKQYTDARHPEHNAALNKMKNLFAFAHPA